MSALMFDQENTRLMDMLHAAESDAGAARAELEAAARERHEIAQQLGAARVREAAGAEDARARQVRFQGGVHELLHPKLASAAEDACARQARACWTSGVHTDLTLASAAADGAAGRAFMPTHM